jgi:hypothetical protein
MDNQADHCYREYRRGHILTGEIDHFRKVTLKGYRYSLLGIE